MTIFCRLSFVLGFSVSIIALTPTLHATTGVSGSCAIRGDQMVGTIHNASGASVWISGYVEFRLFDEDLSQLYSYRTRKSGSVSTGSRVLEEKNIPSFDLDDARNCSFDVSDAVDDGSDDQPTYTAFCTMDGSKAIGRVRYTSGLSYSGDVYYRFYDANRSLLHTYKTRKNGLNGGSGVANLGSYMLPRIFQDDVESCAFDISEAVKP